MPERNMSCPVLTSVSLLMMIIDMVILSSTSIEGISSSSTPSFPNFNFAAVGDWACVLLI
jgi:hypothetical protein